MSVQRTAASHVDVLDHILDKGIVIDAWISLSLAGIDLVALESRVVVASIETYISHAEVLRTLTTPPRLRLVSTRPA